MVKVLELEDTDSDGAKNERRLKCFLATLVNLERLKLGANCTSIIALVLSLRLARSELPSLRTLQLRIPHNAKAPFDSKVYRHLDAYPSLLRLEILYQGSGSFPCDPRGGQAVAKVKELVLKGTGVDSLSTYSFVDNFPNVTSLTLDTLQSHQPQFSSLLSALPISLTSLTLRNLGFYDGYSKPCDHHLPRFLNLEHLYLSEGTFTPDLPVYLRQLVHLETLGFGLGAILDRAKLEGLVLGPNRIPLLRKLIFDQVEGKIGWRIDKDSEHGDLHPDSAHSTWHLGPGWIMPQWSPTFPASYKEDEMLEFVRRIKAEGIEIEGKVLEAFGVFIAWGREVNQCVIAHAWMTGDFSECRELYGDEFVEGILEEEGIFGSVEYDEFEWDGRY